MSAECGGWCDRVAQRPGYLCVYNSPMVAGLLRRSPEIISETQPNNPFAEWRGTATRVSIVMNGTLRGLQGESIEDII